MELPYCCLPAAQDKDVFAGCVLYRITCKKCGLSEVNKVTRESTESVRSLARVAVLVLWGRSSIMRWVTGGKGYVKIRFCII